MKKVYIAGPFFNETEVANVEKVEAILVRRGYESFSPMRHTVEAEQGTVEWAHGIFELDRSNLDASDVIVMLYYGNYSDTGTAWECGYAYAKGIPVVLVHVNENADSNLMLHIGSATNIAMEDLETYDFETLPRYEYEGKMF